MLKGGYPIIFASNVFHISHLIQKCIQNQQLSLILYTLLNQMNAVKNIRYKDDRITSLYPLDENLSSLNVGAYEKGELLHWCQGAAIALEGRH